MLNFGEKFPVRKDNGCGHNITMICFLFQQLHGICQANMEGNHRVFVALRGLQGQSGNPELPLLLEKMQRASLSLKGKFTTK